MRSIKHARLKPLRVNDKAISRSSQYCVHFIALSLSLWSLPFHNASPKAQSDDRGQKAAFCPGSLLSRLTKGISHKAICPLSPLRRPSAARPPAARRGAFLASSRLPRSLLDPHPPPSQWSRVAGARVASPSRSPTTTGFFAQAPGSSEFALTTKIDDRRRYRCTGRVRLVPRGRVRARRSSLLTNRTVAFSLEFEPKPYRKSYHLQNNGYCTAFLYNMRRQ